jgi:glycosyltransferase involved in cell wall biosynthesis
MDVFVMPSSVETFSNATLEAMAMARPVLLSEVGGAPEMVESDSSGLLFNLGNQQALYDALIRLHDSKELRDNLGQAARARVLESFTFGEMIERYRRVTIGQIGA